MAVSVVPQNCVIDLRCSTPADSTKYLQGGPHFYHEQMEYNEYYFDESITKFNYNNHVVNNNSHNNHSPDHYPIAQNYQNSAQSNGCNRATVNNFVDSPPSDSKDEWSNEYTHEIQEPTNNKITENSTMHGESVARKRRMEWANSADALDEQVEIVLPKVRSLDGKGRSSRKSSGRLDWPNDIDLDLGGELSNNGYISDSLLNFPNLTVFKQESQSPPQEPRKHPRHSQDGPNLQNHSQQQSSAINENTQRFQEHTLNGNALNNDRNDSNTNSHPNNGGQQSATHHTTVSGHMMDQSSPTGGGGGGGSGQGTMANLQNFMQQSGFDGGASGGQQQQQGSGGIRSSNLIDDCRFQYVLAAATSIATKNNEESLTYLNQGQSYEIKLKKLGDLSSFRGKVMKSIVKICFHERRLQYMEREQMHQWASSRPGERILDVDIPLSYGLITVNQPTTAINTIEILWDPMKEVGVYVRVNCISTEFTPKKHGGEKGVPFRIQVETYFDHSATSINLIDGIIKPLHAGACQIKVFKLKGADRKHKQDREKIQKRPQTEQEKFQRSCECTILNDISCDSVGAAPRIVNDSFSPELIKRNISPLLADTSPVHIHKYDGIINFCNNPNSPIGINNVSSTNGLCKMMDQSMLSPQAVDMDEYTPIITKDSTPAHLAQWMTYHRLQAYAATFAHFSGADLLRMAKEDLVQICGLADGIRMFNILHIKALTPRLTMYVSFDGTMYHAVYLHSNTLKELTQKLYKLPGFVDCLQSSTNSVGSGAQSGPVSPNNGSPTAWDQQQQQQQQQGCNNNNTYDGATTANLNNSSSNNPNNSNSNSSGSNSSLKMFIYGPNGIHVLVTDEVLSNIKDESLFALQMHNGKLLMKAVYKSAEL